MHPIACEMKLMLASLLGVFCRADKAGKLLAEVLLKGLQGNRYACKKNFYLTAQI